MVLVPPLLYRHRLISIKFKINYPIIHPLDTDIFKGHINQIIVIWIYIMPCITSLMCPINWLLYNISTARAIYDHVHVEMLKTFYPISDQQPEQHSMHQHQMLHTQPVHDDST